MSWRRIHHRCKQLCVHPQLSSKAYIRMSMSFNCIYFGKLHARNICLMTKNVTCQVLSSRGCYSRISLLKRDEFCIPLNFMKREYHKDNKNATENIICKERNNIEHESIDSTAKKDSQLDKNLPFLEARRRALFRRARQLSPLQRVTEMMKEPNKYTNEISNNSGEHAVQSRLEFENENIATSVQGDTKHTGPDGKAETSFNSKSSLQSCHLPNYQSSMPLTGGEFVIILRHHSKKSSLKVLTMLQESRVFGCRWGSIAHREIIGHSAGRVFKTHLGFQVVIRRPSLEEYVLLMKRSPAITYPKDASTMLMMVDVAPGDVVLEAGTGSGAMTLFLSKAVGSNGRVLTYEARRDHHERGVKNWRKWKASWDISHNDRQWPDNVSFHNAALQQCSDVIGDDQVDGVILDVGNTVDVLPIVCRKVKAGRVIAVYVPQITLAVEILNAICVHQLPLILESVLEVGHKSWLVKAANICDRRIVLQDGETDAEETTHNKTDCNEKEGYGMAGVNDSSNLTTKYVCRPHHVQAPHSGFLLQLRKILNLDVGSEY